MKKGIRVIATVALIAISLPKTQTVQSVMVQEDPIVIESESEPIVIEVQEINLVPVVEHVHEPEAEIIRYELGEYTLTAYCSCEKCCGEWAKNRPDGIVYGAAGIELVQGVSVACNLPFGTEIVIDGIGEYTVQDRTASWVQDKYNGKIIDIYFSSHDEAVEFGKQQALVYTYDSTLSVND